MTPGENAMGEPIQVKRLEETIYKFDLSAEAQEFVADWDAHRTPKPIRFDLELRKQGAKSSAFGSI